MARQTSKGICTFCHREFSKSAMARHLETCEQRVSTEAKAGSRRKAQKIRTFHLVVEGRDLPMYWMHLDATASTTLATLDRFLRETWQLAASAPAATLPGSCRPSAHHIWKRSPACTPRRGAKM